jgi:NADH-quinone oxidoreductase subunit J
MNALIVWFYFSIALAALAALSALFVRDVFKSALLVLCCFLALASLYIFAMAEYVAVVQILVYAGGILIVIIFGIMLTSRPSGKALQAENVNRFAGTLAGLGLFIVLIYAIRTGFTDSLSPLEAPASLETIGTSIVTRYSMPFELAGILMLVALLGAMVVASFSKSKKT